MKRLLLVAALSLAAMPMPVWAGWRLEYIVSDFRYKAGGLSSDGFEVDNLEACTAIGEGLGDFLRGVSPGDTRVWPDEENLMILIMCLDTETGEVREISPKPSD